MAQREERKYLALWIKNKLMYLPLKNVEDSFMFSSLPFHFTSTLTKLFPGTLSIFQTH